MATTLASNSPTSVTGVAGAVVTPAPSVIVKDQKGAPLGGATVTFSVISGGGSVSGATVNTDASGTAAVGEWTLGPVAGQNVLRASSGSLEAVTFTAVSTPGPAASITRNAGDNQTAVAGSAVPIAPSVIVKDANGNPKPGASVTFAVVSGGGSVSGAAVTTDTLGIATVGSWTLGPVPGANVLRATSGSLEGVSFTATSTAGAAASLARNAGDNQTAAAGSPVPVAPSVIVKDANGNAAPGVSVTFAVVSGGGSVSGAVTTTNAFGIATVGSWTLGPVAGTNVLSATSGTLAAVTFTAVSTPGAAASIAKIAGDNQSVAAGGAVPVAPAVIVRDAQGNAKAGVSVTFAVLSGGGSITGANAVTDGEGKAAVGSWTLGNSPGVNSLSATVGGLSPVTFTAVVISAACADRSIHTFGVNSSGSLSPADCLLPDGSFVDYYTTTVPQAGTYFFRQTAAFDTYLHLALPDGTAVGENDDELESGTNSGIKAILPAGSYVVGPGSWAPGVTGDYTISSATAPSDVADCETVFVVKGVTTTQNITTADCNLADAGASPIYSDAYFIFLNAGTSVTISMTSGPLDSFLQIVRLDGVVVAQNDNRDATTKDARITFTATQSDYYAIFARSVPTSATGAYTLTIQ